MKGRLRWTDFEVVPDDVADNQKNRLGTAPFPRVWPVCSQKVNPSWPVLGRVGHVAHPTIYVPPNLPKPAGVRYSPSLGAPGAKSKSVRYGWNPPDATGVLHRPAACR